MELKTLMIGYLLGGLSMAIFPPKPKNEVQPGFVAPANIEMKCKDFDKSDGQGLPETYFKVDGKQYVLHYDKAGMPRLSEYKMKIMEKGDEQK